MAAKLFYCISSDPCGWGLGTKLVDDLVSKSDTKIYIVYTMKCAEECFKDICSVVMVYQIHQVQKVESIDL